MKLKSSCISWVLWALCLASAFLPGQRIAANNLAYIAALVIMGTVYAWRRNHWLAGLSFAFILAWMLSTRVFNALNPILMPCPEDVFNTFITRGPLMLRGVFSSLELLLIGFCVSLTLGVGLGLLAGCSPGFKKAALPVAKVLCPIPAPIYAPYVVALAPSFRAASAVILTLGLLLPTFLNVVARLEGMDRRLRDSARVLALGRGAMILRVLLPYALPGVLSGLHTSLSTSFMILMVAEMMGATSGLGYFIRHSADYANYQQVAAGIILTGVVITLLNGALSAFERRALAWAR